MTEKLCLAFFTDAVDIVEGGLCQLFRAQSLVVFNGEAVDFVLNSCDEGENRRLCIDAVEIAVSIGKLCAVL